MKRLCFSIAGIVTLALAADVGAATIGAGIGILDLAGANNTFDTPSDGTTDQSRQNLDQTFTVTLQPGVYQASSWSFRAGQTGSVTPYVARATGPDSYIVLAAGSLVDVAANDLDVDMTVAFGGTDTFTLDAPTEIFGGIVNPKVAGSQNPVYTNLASGSTVDHDNNADGNLSEAIVGGTIDGFGHANLGRSYAFSIEIDPIPEPSPLLLAAVAALGAGVVVRRRRR